MLFEDVDEGLKELVVIEAAGSLSDPLCVVHRETWQYRLKFVHLTLSLLHGADDVVGVYRFLLQKLFHSI